MGRGVEMRWFWKDYPLVCPNIAMAVSKKERIVSQQLYMFQGRAVSFREGTPLENWHDIGKCPCSTGNTANTSSFRVHLPASYVNWSQSVFSNFPSNWSLCWSSRTDRESFRAYTNMAISINLWWKPKLHTKTHMIHVAYIYRSMNGWFSW